MHDSFGIPVNVHVQASVQNNSPKGGLRLDALPIPDRGEGGVESTGSPSGPKQQRRTADYTERAC